MLNWNDSTSVKRGVRTINGRKQVLIQDEIQTQSSIQWRMHTNATVTTDSNSATLTIGDKQMRILVLSPTSGATIGTSPAQRAGGDATPLVPDQPNPDVTVLTINLDAGNQNLQVLFNPQWDGMSESDFKTPPSVALDNWSLDSHN